MQPKFIIKTATTLDLYGKVDGLHYFSDNSAKDGDRAMRVWVLKAKPKLTINSLPTVNGNTIFRQTTSESSKNQSWTRLAFAGLKFADYGSFDYGRNYGVMYDIEAGPIRCLNLAVTLIPMRTTLRLVEPMASRLIVILISSVW